MRPETVRNIMLGAAAGIVGLSCLCGGAFGLFQLYHARKRARLNDSVHQLTQGPAGKDESAGPYLTGKVVLVDRNKRELDELHRSLPAELRAETLSEVGTVVWLEWDHKWIHGSKAPVCKVTVIDRGRNVIVGEGYFEGDPPPMPNAIDRLPVERRPDREIMGWLKSLPRR